MGHAIAERHRTHLRANAAQRLRGLRLSTARAADSRSAPRPLPIPPPSPSSSAPRPDPPPLVGTGSPPDPPAAPLLPRPRLPAVPCRSPSLPRQHLRPTQSPASAAADDQPSLRELLRLDDDSTSTPTSVGSRSISATSSPARDAATATATARVVLPLPPFCDTNASTVAMTAISPYSLCHGARHVTIAASERPTPINTTLGLAASPNAQETPSGSPSST